MKDHFFEIPIYRCAPEKYSEEMRNLKKEIRKNNEHNRTALPYQNNDKLEDDIFRIYHYPYAYNEIVGWIRLYILGNQIRGYTFFESSPVFPFYNKKRITKGIRKKRFEEKGKLFELNINKNITTEQILSKLHNSLIEKVKDDPILSKRFVDINPLLKIGPFINWKELVLNLNPYNKL